MPCEIDDPKWGEGIQTKIEIIKYEVRKNSIYISFHFNKQEGAGEWEIRVPYFFFFFVCNIITESKSLHGCVYSVQLYMDAVLTEEASVYWTACPGRLGPRAI